jgi:hypothetical protein
MTSAAAPPAVVVAPHRPFASSPWLLLLPVIATLAGCQNRPAVLPPPSGMFNRPDAYYTPPAGAAIPAATPLGAAASPVSLAPPASSTGRNSGTAITGRSSNPSQNTYDVASRVAADAQPIRVFDGTPRGAPAANTTALRGMPVNDGSNVSSWRTGITPAPPGVALQGAPTSINSHPLSGLRGTTVGSRPAVSQGLSGQDGQWRSRSSYEATERR